MATNNKREKWNRTYINMRLTKKRREQLEQIAKSADSPLTPQEAIDLALMHPGELTDALAEQLSDLAEASELRDHEHRRSFAQLSEQIFEMARSIQELCELISTVAAESDEF
jgi:hypothetical protein